MKLASKFIAAFAVIASFSSFAADPILGLADVADVTAALELAGDGTVSTAAILQSSGTSFATIEQTGANAAVIVQSVEGSRAAIIQTGSENIAVIVQQ